MKKYICFAILLMLFNIVFCSCSSPFSFSSNGLLSNNDGSSSASEAPDTVALSDLIDASDVESITIGRGFEGTILWEYPLSEQDGIQFLDHCANTQVLFQPREPSEEDAPVCGDTGAEYWIHFKKEGQDAAEVGLDLLYFHNGNESGSITAYQGGDELMRFLWEFEFIKNDYEMDDLWDGYIRRQQQLGIPCDLSPIPKREDGVRGVAVCLNTAEKSVLYKLTPEERDQFMRLYGSMEMTDAPYQEGEGGIESALYDELTSGCIGISGEGQKGFTVSLDLRTKIHSEVTPPYAGYIYVRQGGDEMMDFIWSLPPLKNMAEEKEHYFNNYIKWQKENNIVCQWS